MVKPAAKIVRNLIPKMRTALGEIVRREVLAGVPIEDAQRKDENRGKEMNNATIAYIMDNGSPAANIPAHPFMDPGIQNAKKQIAEHLGHSAKRVFTGETAKAVSDLHKVGLTAQASIREVINSGPPPELSPSTIAARKRRGRISTKPLVDTAQLRNSINYAIRDKK